MSRRIFTTPQPAQGTSTDEVPASETFDVDKLLENCGELLRREIRNLMTESSRGKLNAASARDLVNYLRLLHELKAEQAAALADLSDEELERLAKK